MTSTSNRRILLTAIACAFAVLPFANKAFHIDDVGFLSMVRELGWNPFPGPSTSPSLHTSTHAVFLPYLIKILIALFGEDECSLHAFFALFPFIALVGVNGFYAQGVARPAGAAVPALVLLLAMPAFLVNAQTIMADIPSLAFVIVGMLLFIRSVEDRDAWAAGGAGISFVVASLITYQMLFALPIAFFYSVLRRRGWRSSVIALSLPIALFGGWLLFVYVKHGVVLIAFEHFADAGQGVAGEIKRGLRSDIFWGKVIFTLAMLGASLLFAYAYRCIVLKKVFAAVRNVLLFAAGAYLPALAFSKAPPLQMVGLSLLLGLCIAILVEVVQQGMAPEPDGRKRAQRMLFLVWGSTVVAYVIGLMPFGSARYLLPALPPYLFLLLDLPEASEITPKRRRSANLVIAFAILFGIASAYSDYRYAEVYRNFADEVAQFRQRRPASTTVWYIGKWGMSYYLEKVGSRLLHVSSVEPKKGDFVIIPDMGRFYMPAQEMQQRMTFYASRMYRSPFPLRLFNGRSNAGFYAHHWGILPFSFSLEPDEIFVIYEVTS